MQKYIQLAVTLALLASSCLGCTKARHLAKANKYFAAGDYNQAELEYIYVIRREANAQAYKNLGIICLEEGRLQNAMFLLNRASGTLTNDLVAREKLGEVYFSLGDLVKAHTQAIAVLNKNPGDPKAALLLADSVFSTTELTATRQRLEKLSVPPPQRAAIEVALGNLSLRENEFKTAQEHFEKARALDPKLPELYVGVGDWYWAQSDTEQADKMLQKAAELAPPRSPIHLKYAQFKLKNGDIPAAKTILEGITKQTPDYLPAWLGLAQIAMSEKKYDDGAAALNKVLSADAQNYDGLMLMGQLDFAKNDFPAAIANYEKMEKLYARSAAVELQLGLAHQSNNELVAAITCLNKALVLQPGLVEATLALDEVKIRQGNFDAAIQSLKDTVGQQPKNTKALLYLADAYQRAGELQQSVETYAQLEELLPKNALVPYMKALVLDQQHQTKSARVSYEKSLELAPENISPLEKLVDLDLAEKHSPAAIKRVENQLEKFPKDQEYRMLIAKIYLIEGNTNQAVASLSKAIELRTNFFAAYMMLGNIYIDGGQYKNAAAALAKAAEINPENPVAWTRLGQAQTALDDYAGARDSYEKVLKINPKFISALNNLADLYSEKLGNLDKAYEMARRALDVVPLDPNTAPYMQDTLGWIYYKKGDYSQALNLLEEAAGPLANSAEVEFHLGMADYMLGDETAAQRALQLAAQSKDAFSGKDQIADRLAILAIDAKTAGPDAQARLEKRVAERKNDAIAWKKLASIFRQTGRSEQAIAAYENVLKLNPKDAGALLNLALLYEANPKSLDKAMEAANQSYQLTPDDPAVSAEYGRLTYRTGNYKRAANVLQLAASKRPNDAQLSFDLAQALYSIGQVTDAQNAAQNALSINPNFSRSAEAHRLLDLIALIANPPATIPPQVADILKTDPNYVPAMMVEGAGDEQKSGASGAVEIYQKVLGIYPDFIPAKKRLVILYSEQPSHDRKAYELAVNVWETLPDDPQVAKALGILSYQQSEYVRAQKLLQENAGADPQALYYLGMAEYQLKQKAESKKTLSRVVKMPLPNDLLDTAKKALAEMK